MQKLSLLSFVLVFTCQAFAQSYERYEVVSMGKTINTHYHEAAPVISPDGKTLYFFVDGHPENTYGKEGSQDIWVTRKGANGEWSAPEHLKAPFNNSHSNQVFTVLSDGTLFIKGGRGKDQKGFSLVTPGGGQTELAVQDFGKMNKGRFYGASMSADRKHMIIYFSESEGSAVSDLYISHAGSGSTWSRPVKLKVSHSLDDFAPFIAPDQKTMYYASARPGQGRQGGADIYKTTRLDDTWENWSTPENLGRPINTAAMDAYFSIDAEGRVFMARANSRVDGGNLDLFMLVPKQLKIALKGSVYNEKTEAPVISAIRLTATQDTLELGTDATGKFECRLEELPGYTVSAMANGFMPRQIQIALPALVRDTTIYVEIPLTPIDRKQVLTLNTFNKKTNQRMDANVLISLKDETGTTMSLRSEGGTLKADITREGWHMIVASEEGFLSANDSLWVPALDKALAAKSLYLQPIEVGTTVRLRNVYFDFDKTTLKSESFTELNKVVDFLSKNPTVEIEIAGHTDSKGSDDYNRNLSQGRCQSVVDYLVSQGIESYRLTPHGYGESEPIDTNDTDAGRANNRRVELKVLKM